MKRHAKLALVVAVPLFLASCSWFKKAEAPAESAGEVAAEKAVEKAAEGTPVAALQTTPSGLQIEVLKAAEANAPEAQAGKDVTVLYTGWTEENGQKTVFDSTDKHGKAFTFKLGAGNVIKGWDEGIANMKAGEKRKLVIPPALAYGEKGAGNVIKPNATLHFEVEVVSVS